MKPLLQYVTEEYVDIGCNALGNICVFLSYCVVLPLLFPFWLLGLIYRYLAGKQP